MEQARATRILLVEDEPLIAMAEKMTLERSGYLVTTARSGEAAVDIICAGEAIDLVLMDIDLGNGMRGTEAATRILSQRDLPLVFLSSHTEPEVVKQTEGISSYGYIVKNSGDTVLLASIRMAFRLFESRRRASDTFTHSINGICVHRTVRNSEGLLTDCEYLQVNKAFEQHTGLRGQDIIGRTIRDLYPGAQAEDVIHLYHEVLAGRAESRQELYFEPSQAWFELSLFPTSTDEFTVVVDNVTRRKLAEQSIRESESRLQEIFDHMNDAFAVHEVIWGADGEALDYRFTEVNSVFAARLGMEAAQIVGHTALELFPATEATWVQTFARVARSGEPEQITEYSAVLGRYYETRLYCPQPGYCAGIFMDVTDRKRAEEKLARHQRELIEINRIGALANRDLDLDGMLSCILEQTTTALGAAAGMVFLYDADTQTLGWGAAIGLSEEFVGEFKRSPIRLGEGLTGTIAQTKEPVFIPRNSSFDRRIARSIVRHEELNSFIGVPILAGEQVIGVMNILTRAPDELTGEDIPFCSAIGVQVGWAIVNARLQAEQSQAQEELLYKESTLRSMLENMSDAFWSLSWPEQELRFIGPAIEELYGRPVQDFYENPSLYREYTHAEDLHTIDGALSQLAQHGCSKREARVVLPDGTERWIRDTAWLVYDDAGTPIRVDGLATDISDYKRAEAEVARQLAEKESLLREVNHRVKNNIASIKSLLTLQADVAGSPEARRALLDAASRVQSMAELYNKLLLSGEYRSTSMKEYAEALIHSILDALSASTAIQVQTQIEEFTIDAKKAVSVGIILNELVTNACKYAFPGRAHGNLQVTVARQGNSVELTVQDDGVGLGAKASGTAPVSSGFGLMLVNMLAEQLNGSVVTESSGGTKTVVTFVV